MGIRCLSSKARAVLPHAVVDQTVQSSPLGAVGTALYIIVFLGVLTAAHRRPSFGTAALVAFAPFAFYRDVDDTTVTFFKVALLGMMAGLLLRRSNVAVARGPISGIVGWCAAAVVVATALSIAQASYREAALRETAKSVEYFVIFLSVVIATRLDPDDRAVRISFAGTSLAVSALAILQEFTGAPSGFWLRGHALPRVAGPLEGPNQLSAYLGITLCVVVAYMCGRKATPLEMIALPLGCMALTLTVSRAGLFTGLAALVLVCVLTKKRVPRFVPASIIVGVGAGIGLLAVWIAAFNSTGAFDAFGRFSNLNETMQPGSVGTRAHLWRAAFILWRDHPIFGIGAGNFEQELGRVGLPKIHTHANSLYLQALVEGGVPLLVATLAAVFVPIVRLARSLRAHPLVVAACAAGIGLALHQIVDLLVFYSKIGVSWWILLGLGAAYADAWAPGTAKTRTRALAQPQMPSLLRKDEHISG